MIGTTEAFARQPISQFDCNTAGISRARGAGGGRQWRRGNGRVGLLWCCRRRGRCRSWPEQPDGRARAAAEGNSSHRRAATVNPGTGQFPRSCSRIGNGRAPM